MGLASGRILHISAFDNGVRLFKTVASIRPFLLILLPCRTVLGLGPLTMYAHPVHYSMGVESFVAIAVRRSVFYSFVRSGGFFQPDFVKYFVC